MKKVAVVLSGCGVFDGSEIHESVLTLLALDRANAEYQCVAPNIPQHHVTNHLTREVEVEEKRNALVEAARIARGDILDLGRAKPEDYDAAIFPGGFGAVTNLSSFAERGASCEIQPGVLAFSRKMFAERKPMGFICIAPVMISKICGLSVKHTIGNDAQTADAITAMGGHHVNCGVTQMVVDEQYKIVSTPAYMLARRISEVATGIDALVQEVLALA